MNSGDLELAKAAAEGTAAGLTQSLQQIILELAEPVALEIGAELGDVVRSWRLRRAERVGRRAISIIERAGTPRRCIPVKVLIPALEHASLEEDAELQERWARLLATAADATALEITREFPEILKVLTPRDVRVLDWLFDHPPELDPNEPGVVQGNQYRGSLPEYVRPRAEKASIVAEFHFSDLEFELVASRLEHLGLCDVGRYVFPARYGATSSTGPRKYDSLTLRPLGEAFVRACRGGVQESGADRARALLALEPFGPRDSPEA